MNAPLQNLPLKMARANLESFPEFALPAGFSLRWYQPGDEAHWRRIHLAAERFIDITPELFNDRFGENTALLPERQCYVVEPGGEVVGTGTAWFDDRLAETSLSKTVKRTETVSPSPPDAGRRRGPGRGGAFRTAPLSGSLPVRSSRGESGGALRSVERADADRPCAARWGRVHWMAILPEFQGRGLGKALLTAICRRLRELGHERAFLHTSAARTPAIRLYLKFGFEPMIRNDEEAAVWKAVLGGLHRIL